MRVTAVPVVRPRALPNVDGSFTGCRQLATQNGPVRRALLPIALVLAFVVGGCGGSHGAHRTPVVTSKQWAAVVNDWLDNARIDGRYSCGAVVEAVAHISALHPPYSPTWQRAVPMLDRYSSQVCTRHPQLPRIVVGMTDAEVAEVAGMPRTPRLRCWLYPVLRDLPGRRVCFDRWRVTLVQVSVHF